MRINEFNELTDTEFLTEQDIQEINSYTLYISGIHAINIYHVMDESTYLLHIENMDHMDEKIIPGLSPVGRETISLMLQKTIRQFRTHILTLEKDERIKEKND